MAYILLVDPDEVAQKAMKGILERGNHRFAAVDSAADALDFIRDNIKVDLLVAELRLKEESGIGLIQSLKNDRYLSALPVIVYTANGDRASVKTALSLRAQNVLLKPYRDDAVFGEISKGLARHWRQLPFEREKAFCQLTNIEPETLHKKQEELRKLLSKVRAPLEKLAEERSAQPISDLLEKLSEKAVAAGATGVADCLEEMKESALAANWSAFSQSLVQLDFLARIIYHHLRPNLTPEGFLTEEEINQENEARERAHWADAPSEERCPVIGWDQLKRELDALSGFPVVDSIAASFQMSANGHPTSLSPLLDLVQRDPALTAHILVASNRIKRGKNDGDSTPIEEPRMAVGLLGELRLAALGGSLETVEDRLLLEPPHCSWPFFRMFQLGTAQLARFVCNYLEMPNLETAAYTAGLLHDIGKLLLVHLHPFAFQAIQTYARQRGMKLAAAERYFMQATTHEMAAYFAEKQGLPPRFVHVLRWIDTPGEATVDAELVAIVSLARSLCRHNHVGFNGDTPMDDAEPIEETAEWRVLRSRVFLNFDLKKFERQAHFECQQLKRDLLGKLGK